MGQAESQPRIYTVEEYMELEKHSNVRHEFYEGEVFARTGASARHNSIAGNTYAFLLYALRGKKCRAYFESVQLEVAEGRYYNYPDVMVTCSPDDLRAERTMKEPVLVVEVLSKSTEGLDRTWKFNQYKQLPSLKHYLLVSQTTCSVEWYRREANDIWGFTALVLFTDEIPLPELGIVLKLSDIYEETGVAQMVIRYDSEEPGYKGRANE